MEPQSSDPLPYCFIYLADIIPGIASISIIASFIAMMLLLLLSALISGSEVAFFSLPKAEIDRMKNSESRSEVIVSGLLENPKRLLATILIGNNFVNVAIIILSTYLASEIIPPHMIGGIVAWIIQVILVTLLILLVGEVVPKVYATQHALRFSVFLAFPMYFMKKALHPFSTVLVASTTLIDKRISQKGHQISVDELSHALDLTTDSEKATPEDHKILRGIVSFGNTDVKQIMRSRMDVKAFDIEITFEELIPMILEAGYSRIPVYKESFDNVVGVIYIKDILPHLDKGSNFHWQSLMRPPFFVPESKKIDDLLREFQTRKIHLAVVVDEYGGTSGIVTLEDVIEEIVGDINDEFDDEELIYSKLDDFNYILEGKVTLNQFYRVLNIDGEEFEAKKGESDSLAGFILELEGKIPKKNQKIRFETADNDILFTIESADLRRIKRVKVTIIPKEEEEDIPHKSKSGKAGGFLFGWLILSLFFISCDSEFTPKPRGYFRIDLPKKEYQTYDSTCPFQFDYPVYALVVPNSSQGNELCWMNVEFSKFKGTLHLSYKGINNNLANYIEESRKLTNKHIAKAYAINENKILMPDRKVYGLIYEVEGNDAASTIQFYLTDSTKHFMRGALYFNAVPNNDSLAPVLEFVKYDIYKFIDSFNWK